MNLKKLLSIYIYKLILCPFRGIKRVLFKPRYSVYDKEISKYSDVSLLGFVYFLLIYLISCKILTNKFFIFNEKMYFYLVISVILESINSAIELICDYIQPNYDERIKDIKDVASTFFSLALFFQIIHIIMLKSKI